jgi:glycerol-3-phosphate dehydrogenase
VLSHFKRFANSFCISCKSTAARYDVGMRIAVVGGGINGSGVAWELARRDYEVTLLEKGRCGAQTSANTTKLIHGGIRYLERGHIGLVRESLRERAWLLEHLPQLVHPIEFLLPVYDDSPRLRMTLWLGLSMYDALAGRANIARHHAVGADELVASAPVTRERLRGGFRFWDAQTDDYAMARAVVASAIRDGVTVREGTRMTSLERDGKQWIVNGAERFDFVVNAAGPWMNDLLRGNGLRSRYRLSLVRGSHLVLKQRVADVALLLQSMNDRRVFFVLPWKGTTLVGTTEVLHTEPMNGVVATEEEIDYLIARFNRYFRTPISRDDVASTFAGVRPLVGRAANPSAIGREYRIERRGNLINIFGGKMTTFMSLARKVAMRVDNYFGTPRMAREPRFTITP